MDTPIHSHFGTTFGSSLVKDLAALSALRPADNRMVPGMAPGMVPTYPKNVGVSDVAPAFATVTGAPPPLPAVSIRPAAAELAYAARMTAGRLCALSKAPALASATSTCPPLPAPAPSAVTGYGGTPSQDMTGQSTLEEEGVNTVTQGLNPRSLYGQQLTLRQFDRHTAGDVLEASLALEEVDVWDCCASCYAVRHPQPSAESCNRSRVWCVHCVEDKARDRSSRSRSRDKRSWCIG